MRSLNDRSHILAHTATATCLCPCVCVCSIVQNSRLQRLNCSNAVVGYFVQFSFADTT